MKRDRILLAVGLLLAVAALSTHTRCGSIAGGKAASLGAMKF